MVAARVQVGVGLRGLRERVGPPHRNGEPAAGRQGGQFRQGLRRAVRRVRAGEPDAVVRGVVVGDGDDARPVSGQADRAGEQAGPGRVEHGVHPAGRHGTDALRPAIAVPDRGGPQPGEPAEVTVGGRPDDADAPGGRQLDRDGADAAAGAEDDQRLAGREAEVLQHPERRLADRDQGGGGLRRQRRGLGDRPVEQRVLAVAAGGGHAEYLVARRRGGARPSRVDDASHVPARQHGELNGEDAVHPPAADLGVDRVDGDRADADPDLAWPWLRDVRGGQRQHIRAAVPRVGDHCVHRNSLRSELETARITQFV